MNVTLRDATKADLLQLFYWAHMPEIYTYMPSRHGKDISWEDHMAWWQQPGRLSGHRRDWMIMLQGTSVGLIHMDGANHHPPEVGLFIADPGHREHGVGRQALDLVIRRAELLKHLQLSAVIHPKNTPSIRLFTGAGFKKIGGGRNGQETYRKDLASTPV